MGQPGVGARDRGPGTAPKGAEITLGFRVPNEEATASTVKVQIFFPSDPPVLGVDPEEAPGWTNPDSYRAAQPAHEHRRWPHHQLRQRGGLVRRINTPRPLPGVLRPGPAAADDHRNQVVFKALQTYSDGNVVRWIQTTPPGGPVPDHPAPVLTLTAPASGSPASSGGGSDGLALAGVVLGALGLLLGAVAVVLVVQRGRRQSERGRRHRDEGSA